METLTINNNETLPTSVTEPAKKGKSKKTKTIPAATEAIATTPVTEVIEQTEVVEHPIVREEKPKSQPRHRKQGITLTDREKQVLKDLANGLSNNEVAQRLALSRRTIEAHRARIMLKLNVHTMAGLTKYAIKDNLVNLD